MSMMELLSALLVGCTILAQDRANPHALIVQDFEKRVTDYVNLRKSFLKDLPANKPTDDPQAISNRQQELARRIRRARAHAHQGEIFTPEISAEFHSLLGFALEGKNDGNISKSLARSEPVRMTVHVNDAYPPNVPLQSTPPTILMNLPALPPDLEYRIVGTALVLRDSAANIIVDLIPDAIS